MVAHFVGGPLHGVDRVVESTRRELEVYWPKREFTEPFHREGWPTEFEVAKGHYGRLIKDEFYPNVPAIFVWLD